MDDKKFAVLIDSDNTSADYIKTILDEVTNEGVITYNRIYGDWTSPNLKKWREVLLKYALTPVQQYAYTQGKNSTDSAMIIDAMDILYTGTVDGFCIVSSDCDFTRLATRLREAGKIVIGMGKSDSTPAFVAACNMFKYIDVISKEKSNADTSESVAKQPADAADAPEKPAEKSDAPNLKARKKELKRTIDKMLEEKSDDDGWLLASIVGTLLQRQFSDFDSRNYGFKKTIDLLKHLGYETQSANGKVYYIRIKPSAQKQNKGGKK